MQLADAEMLTAVRTRLGDHSSDTM